MTLVPIKHLHSYTKGGRRYFYFRRGRLRIRLPGQPGTKEFQDAYDRALKADAPPIGASKVKPRSLAALAAHWYGSPGYKALRPQSQRTYRRLADSLMDLDGDKPVALIEPKHIRAILRGRQATPAQANALRNVLRLMMQYACEEDWIKENPCRDIKRLRYEKKPHATWSEQDIAAFEQHWPPGTRGRLALALLLYTGQRRSDVVRMGPQHVRDGWLSFTQQKTGKTLEIPLHPALAAELERTPKDHLAFLMTEYGKAMSPVGFYNWFVECAQKAGLKAGLSPHGLRKAAARRLAEAGCSPHEIMSITGHATLTEVERYTKAVEQKRLASAAVVRLGGRAKKRT